jgi:iron complex transport system substrate-binding protein
VPARPRIASLCPSNTEILCALGLADCLVGVDIYSDYPPEAVRGVPKLGPDLNIDIDLLVSLWPDVTVCSLSVPGMEKVVDAVRNAGLHMIVLSPHSVEDIFTDMETVGKALHPYLPTATVQQVISGLRKRVESVQSATRPLVQRPRLYWEWWPNPIFSPGRDNWLTELSEMAGAQNVFAHVAGPQVQDDGTQVLAAQPDYVLAVWTGIPQHKVPVAKLLSRPDWESLTAIRHGRLFVLAEGLYCRPSPRLIDGLEQLVGLIHPDVAQRLGLPNPETYAPVRRADGTWLGNRTPSS